MKTVSNQKICVFVKPTKKNDRFNKTKHKKHRQIITCQDFGKTHASIKEANAIA